MSNKLYIIGNGFDLHHGIPSSYQAFGIYLKAEDRETYEVLERYFDVDAHFWAEFEERLASLDIDTLADDASNFLVSYSADNWSDAYHHDYQYEVNKVVEAISSTLRLRFAEWIRQLPVPAGTDIADVRLAIDSSAKFLNFNYTPSLQRLYHISDTNILHIHGSAKHEASQLVLGHGWTPPPKPKRKPDEYTFDDDIEDTDVRVAEGQRIIDRYFKETFKPTARIISENISFFSSISDVTDIYVMGHSVSDVDYPYFHEVIRNIKADQVRWKISYFNDFSDLRKRVARLGIAEHLVDFLPLTNFCGLSQFSLF